MPRKLVKEARFTIRASKQDHQLITKKAEQVSLSVSEFFRRSALNKKLPKVPPAINRIAWLKLASLGNVVNQIAMKIHMGEVVALTEEMEAILMETREQIRFLRQDLLFGPNREVDP